MENTINLHLPFFKGQRKEKNVPAPQLDGWKDAVDDSEQNIDFFLMMPFSQKDIQNNKNVL